MNRDSGWTLLSYKYYFISVKTAAIIVLILVCGGCAARWPASYRLVTRDTGAILVPPGVASPDVTKRTFAFRVASKPGTCPSAAGVIALRDRKNRIVVTVSRDALAKQPAGWLSAWTADLERQGCLAEGEGMKLAERIVESLPLELNAELRLLHGSEVDIGPQTRLEVVSPVFREGTPPETPALEQTETAGNGNALTVTMRASANWPISSVSKPAWYGVQTHAGHVGFSIVPLRAERNIQGKIEDYRGRQRTRSRFPLMPRSIACSTKPTRLSSRP